ncbi:hypothetical protein [Brevibacterium sp. CFH 10365]|nr:hypothetical protein [Brevibacterium sp. CFH 10365]
MDPRLSGDSHEMLSRPARRPSITAGPAAGAATCTAMALAETTATK